MSRHGMRQFTVECENLEENMSANAAEITPIRSVRSDLRHAAADGRRDDAKLSHELREGFRFERLRSVGKGVIGIVVDLDQETVCARSHGSARHGRNLVAAARAVRWIAPHGQMRKLFDYGNCGDVECVARISFVSAYTALAQNHVVVSTGENVLRA